jgi:hypothetical protein
VRCGYRRASKSAFRPLPITLGPCMSLVVQRVSALANLESLASICQHKMVPENGQRGMHVYPATPLAPGRVDIPHV